MSSDGAYLFDLDGTLVDNMAIHARSFEVFVAHHGLPPITPALRARLDGKRNRDIFPVLFGRALDQDELARCSAEKESSYRELSSGRLQPIDGLIDLLDALDRAGRPYGIATSAPAVNVEHTLREIGLFDRFGVVARSDEVPRGKPHPDVFLEAARRLRSAPGQCTVFEDAPSGIEGALRAGMRAIAVATTFDAEALQRLTRPDRVIRDYTEWPPP